MSLDVSVVSADGSDARAVVNQAFGQLADVNVYGREDQAAIQLPPPFQSRKILCFLMMRNAVRSWWEGARNI